MIYNLKPSFPNAENTTIKFVTLGMYSVLRCTHQGHKNS